MKNTKRFYGFTLVELLVTIAVIAILAALLFPALKTARERGVSIICAGNLKQQGIAFGMYRADYDDYFPQPRETNTPADESYFYDDWANKLASYVTSRDSFRGYSRKKTVFSCKSPRIVHPGIESAYRDGTMSKFYNTMYDLFHYCANRHLSSDNDGGSPARASGIGIPGATALVMENCSCSPSTSGWMWCRYNGCAPHVRRSNALFCDAHVESISYQDVPLNSWTVFWKGKKYF